MNIKFIGILCASQTRVVIPGEKPSWFVLSISCQSAQHSGAKNIKCLEIWLTVVVLRDWMLNTQQHKSTSTLDETKHWHQKTEKRKWMNKWGFTNLRLWLHLSKRQGHSGKKMFVYFRYFRYLDLFQLYTLYSQRVRSCWYQSALSFDQFYKHSVKPDCDSLNS